MLLGEIYWNALSEHPKYICYHAHPVNQAQIGYGGVAEEQIHGITDW